MNKIFRAETTDVRKVMNKTLSQSQEVSNVNDGSDSQSVQISNPTLPKIEAAQIGPSVYDNSGEIAYKKPELASYETQLFDIES